MAKEKIKKQTLKGVEVMRKIGTVLILVGAMASAIINIHVNQAFAFFDRTVALSSQIITIGEWSFQGDYPEWQNNGNYQVGDRFVYDGKVWEVYNAGDTNKRPGQGNNLVPYGTYQEITDEWVFYNTYYAGDQVFHNGYWWEAVDERVNGTRFNNTNQVNSIEPGTDVGWTRLSGEWFRYNIYDTNDTVTFNGSTFTAQYYNVDTQPGTDTVWQEDTIEWRLYNIYDTGDEVIYEGNAYRAKWYTQGDTPPSSNVWELIN